MATRVRTGASAAASGATLETIGITLLFVTSVAFVTLTDGDSARPRATRAPMQSAVEDVLESLGELELTGPYSTLLEKAVAKAVVGNTTAFDELIRRSLPEGAECRLWIDNAHQRRQLLGPSSDPARETVSASRLWRPTWAYAFALPSFDLISELQPLPVQAYQVSQGSLVQEQGVPVVFTLTTDQGTYHRAGVTASRENAPTVSLFLRNQTGNASFVYLEDPSDEQVSPLLHLTANGPPPSPRNFNVPLGQDELRVTSLFHGTSVRMTITLQPPSGPSQQFSATRPGWTNLTLPAPETGSWTFTATGSVNGDALTPARSEVRVNSTDGSGDNQWDFVLRHEAGDAVPAGARLNLSLSGLITDFARTSTDQPGWANITLSDSLTTGTWVSADLETALQHGQRILRLPGGLPSEDNALYGVTATLSHGAAGRAEFVLATTLGGFNIANDVERDLRVSVPKPQENGSTALWGAVFAHPTTLGDVETVTRLDIRTLEAQSFFASVQGLSPSGTWSVHAPNHLRWEGFQPVLPNRALAFAFNVTSLATAQSGDEPPLELPLSFGDDGRGGGSVFPLRAHERPHIYALNVPPPLDLLGQGQAGFTVPEGSGLTTRGNGTVNSTAYQRGMLVQGSATYGVSAWGSLGSLAEALRTGLARSHVEISKPRVRIGEEVNVSIDFEGLFDEVNLSGQNMTAWNVEIKIFDPAQPFVPFEEMVPSLNASFGASLTLVANRPSLDVVPEWVGKTAEVFTAARGNLTLLVPRGAFYGPHAVLVHSNFMLTEPLTNLTRMQSARLIAVMDVIPDAGQQVSALYWTTLECWLPDW